MSDDVSDPWAAYEYGQDEVAYTGSAGSSPLRKRSGKLSREGERRKKARHRGRNRRAYNRYMRLYRARKRIEKLVAEGKLPPQDA